MTSHHDFQMWAAFSIEIVEIGTDAVGVKSRVESCFSAGGQTVAAIRDAH